LTDGNGVPGILYHSDSSILKFPRRKSSNAYALGGGRCSKSSKMWEAGGTCIRCLTPGFFIFKNGRESALIWIHASLLYRFIAVLKKMAIPLIPTVEIDQIAVQKPLHAFEDW
jgi:hypothetical protein